MHFDWNSKDNGALEMNANQYVNAIARKIRCSGKKKKEIKMQLLTDINMRLEQGEELQEIISQMGTVQEIISGFNESFSEEERKKYRKNKVLMIAIPILAVLVLLCVFVYILIPRGYAIEQSEYFDEAGVEAAMKETVELLDAEEYDALQENAISQMQPFLNKEEVGKIKGQLSDDWGERQKFGTVYMTELVQGNKHLAVGEITVVYENVTVTYRLSYDKEMRLAGLYVR